MPVSWLLYQYWIGTVFWRKNDVVQYSKNDEGKANGDDGNSNYFFLDTLFSSDCWFCLMRFNKYTTSHLRVNYLVYFFLLLLTNWSILNVLFSNLYVYKNTVFDWSVCLLLHTPFFRPSHLWRELKRIQLNKLINLYPSHLVQYNYLTSRYPLLESQGKLLM